MNAQLSEFNGFNKGSVSVQRILWESVKGFIRSFFNEFCLQFKQKPFTGNQQIGEEIILNWKYWNSKVNSFVFAIHLRQLSLRSKDVHEMMHQNFSFYFLVFLSRYHLLCQITHFFMWAKVLEQWLTGVSCCPDVSCKIDWLNNK